jgi:gamma-glutamyltranspeptidase/glutathione hydrolase/leukotriene-C4 hydrolase
LYGFAIAHKHFGGLTWRELFEPTIQLCRDGFRVANALAKGFEISAKALRKDPTLKLMFTNPETKAFFKEGEKMKLPLLAETLDQLSKGSSDDAINRFYKSDLTKVMVREINDKGTNLHN